jgi:hypothetical protein
MSDGRRHKFFEPYQALLHAVLPRAHDQRIDLWDSDSVKSRYSEIKTRVEDGSMPAPGCGEGEWDDHTRDQFLKDFRKWKDGNFTQ